MTKGIVILNYLSCGFRIYHINIVFSTMLQIMVTYNVTLWANKIL